MALTYKPARQAVGVTYATVYTCPAATTAIVLNAQAANVDGTVAADISVQWLDNSAADVATRLGDVISVPPNAALNLLGGPIVLEAGDALQAKASAAGDIEITLAVSELTGG